MIPDMKDQLTEEDINKYLPMVMSSKVQGESKPVDAENDNCMICLEPNSTGQIRVVSLCGHRFHSACLMEWIKQKCFCPNCKQDFSKKYLMARAEKPMVNQPSEATPLNLEPAPRII